MIVEAKPLDLAKKQFHAGNSIRLQFRKWTFETLVKWMAEFCASSVAALQAGQLRAQKVMLLP